MSSDIDITLTTDNQSIKPKPHKPISPRGSRPHHSTDSRLARSKHEIRNID